jgi:hypothetical protein
LNQKVLESTKYPTIIFESTAATVSHLSEGRFQARMNGRWLTAVTNRIQVTETCAGAGEFSLLQRKYGIAPVSVAGGTLEFKDELKFAFDIAVRKQD